METVYVETTIVSYLVGSPSRDLVTAAGQQTTRDWWRTRRHLFECVVSDETLREAARRDAEQVRLRLTWNCLEFMPLHVGLCALLFPPARPPLAHLPAIYH